MCASVRLLLGCTALHHQLIICSPPSPPALPLPLLPITDLHIKNFVRFPAVNGSALDAARLVTPKASEEIALGEPPAPSLTCRLLGDRAGGPASARRPLTVPPRPATHTPRLFAATAAAETQGYRTKHYQLTRGSLGCYMSHLQLYQHIIRGGEQRVWGAAGRGLQ